MMLKPIATGGFFVFEDLWCVESGDLGGVPGDYCLHGLSVSSSQEVGSVILETAFMPRKYESSWYL